MTRSKVKYAPCEATMQGKADPDHTHTCNGDHTDGDHYCTECKRWWWKAPVEGEG